VTLTKKIYSVRGESITHEASATRAMIIVPVLECKQKRGQIRSITARLEEICGLAYAINLNIIYSAWILVSSPKITTLLGTGKVKELSWLIINEMIDLAIIDHSLTPVQQRNLEKVWNCKVIDRTALILEIFGKRARTKEGILQVELAHLNYQKSRLVRSWTHLERQRGGCGFLGGPGETQIESDRRILQEKINRIKRELDTIVKTRQLHRAKRKKTLYPVVALVGYTNAGKSTLFNRLTGADVLAGDMLFATLDLILRCIKLPYGGKIILSDTVGFISNLPTHLVAAFRATLEEVVEADLIIHVRDVSDSDHMAHRQDVLDILSALNVDIDNPDRIIEAWNKIDLLDEDSMRHLRLLAKNTVLPIIPISAVNGQGLDILIKIIENKIGGEIKRVNVCLGLNEQSLLDWLYCHGSDHHQINRDDGTVIINVNLSRLGWHIFQAKRRKLKGKEETPVQ